MNLAPASDAVPGTSRRRWGRYAIAGLVALLMVVAYTPALEAGWIWDDDSYITHNALVQGPEGWWQAWVPGRTPQYYPLVFVSFWVQHALHGLDPLPYHAVNVVLHLASAGLLWRLLGRVGVAGAGLAALLFALHPVQVESVAWVTERKNVLSMACALVSMLAWVRARDAAPGARGSTAWFIVAFAAFCAAMLAKTTAVAVPVAILALEWWKHRRLGAGAGAVVALFMVVGAALSLNTAYIEVTHVGARGPEFSTPFIERLFHASQAWWFYLESWVWPLDIVFIYPPFDRGPMNLFAWLAFTGGVALLAFTAWCARRGSRGPLALLLIYSAGVFPALGFIPVWPHRFSPVADHFGYVGGVAVCVALGWAGARAWGAMHRRGVPPVLGGVVAGLLACVLGALTWQACLPYRDELTLWRWTLERNPRAWIAANNIGNHYLATAREAADAGMPNTVDAALAEAEPLLARAVELSAERDMAALVNLSEVRRLQGKLDEALVAADKAVAANPQYGNVYQVRGRVHELRGDRALATRDYLAAVELNPADTHNLGELIRILVVAGDLIDALPYAERAAVLQPSNPEVLGNLGSINLALGRAEPARAALEEAMRHAPQPLAYQLAVRLADAYLRAPTSPETTRRAEDIAAHLASATARGHPVPLLLSARAQALRGDLAAARGTLAEADALLETADEATRAVSHDYRDRAVHALEHR